MKLNKYMNECGLIANHVAQKMGVSRQQLDQYDESRCPTLKTLEKIAKAMTELGVPTTVADLSKAILKEEN